VNVKTLLLFGKVLQKKKLLPFLLIAGFIFSLTKDPTYRPTPARMLQHPFILKWENVHMDLGQWVKEVWSWQ
jgi:hypothetical protein